MTYHDDMSPKDVSQFGETTFLKAYFLKYPPKYKCLVDVGANGVALSNSYNFLFDYSWKGLLIEANRANFESLEKEYARHPNVILVNVAVADYEGEAKFYIHDIEGHHSLKQKSDRFVMAKVLKLSTVLQNHFIQYDFDYLTIDIEGMDKAVLLDLLENSCYRPKIILHEKDVGKRLGVLENFGYEVIHETQGNLIYRLK